MQDSRRSPANNEETIRLRQQFQDYKVEMEKKLDEISQVHKHIISITNITGKNRT